MNHKRNAIPGDSRPRDHWYRPGCMGSYDFNSIAYYAKRRFVDGCDTVTLMQQAGTVREKEEIALVALLDVDDEKIRELKLSCRHADECGITDCREVLREIIDREITAGRPQ